MLFFWLDVILNRLISNLASNTINVCEIKVSENELSEQEKDLQDIIKVMKSLEDSNVLIDGITETVKTETKNKKK